MTKLVNATPVADAEQPARFPLTRAVVVLLVGLLTIAAVGLGLRWGWYRYHHVVLSEAVVKGTITHIGARIEGRIKSIEVEVGQSVAKGDILLRMEDSYLQAALERGRAELQSAAKELESEKMAIEQSRRRLALDIEQVNGLRKKASGELDAAKGNLASLEKQYERTAALLKSGAAATSEMDRITGERDRAQGAVKAASGVLETAESNFQKAQNELEGLRVRESRLQVLEAQVAVARARVNQAEAELEATVIRAPEAGRVLERTVELGGSAKVGEPMIVLWIGRPWVEAWADERDLRKFRIGSLADVSLDAAPGRKLVGRVESIGLMTDKQLLPGPVPLTYHSLGPVPLTLHSFLPPPPAMVPVRVAFSEDDSPLALGLSVLVGIQKECSAGAGARSDVATTPKLDGAAARLSYQTAP
jgi:multidrug resistance efflux pump